MNNKNFLGGEQNNKKPIDPEIEKKFKNFIEKLRNADSGGSSDAYRIPISELQNPKKAKNKSTEQSDTKPVSPDEPSKETSQATGNEANATSTSTSNTDIQVTYKNNESEKDSQNQKKESPQGKEQDIIQKYLNTLKEQNITPEEAIKILIGVYYKNSYEETYKIVGNPVTFQIPPSGFTDLKFVLLNEISPIYKQHENEISIEIRIAASLKRMGKTVFSEEPTMENLKKRYNAIHSLNEFAKAIYLRKFIDFETKIYTVINTPGADDFFEQEMSRNTSSG